MPKLTKEATAALVVIFQITRKLILIDEVSRIENSKK